VHDAAKLHRTEMVAVTIIRALRADATSQAARDLGPWHKSPHRHREDWSQLAEEKMILLGLQNE
jgi:hypothetical protein